ncbi:hypothetical protein CCUS01_11416, partial [Colletotrichum cuscutae]
TQPGSKTSSLEIQFSSANDPASSVDRSKAQKPKIGPSSESNFPYRVSTVDQPSISRVEGRKNRTLVRRRAALNATPVAYAIVRGGKSPVRRFIVKQVTYSIVPLVSRNSNLLVQGLMNEECLLDVSELNYSLVFLISSSLLTLAPSKSSDFSLSRSKQDTSLDL